MDTARAAGTVPVASRRRGHLFCDYYVMVNSVANTAPIVKDVWMSTTTPGSGRWRFGKIASSGANLRLPIFFPKRGAAGSGGSSQFYMESFVIRECCCSVTFYSVSLLFSSTREIRRSYYGYV